MRNIVTETEQITYGKAMPLEISQPAQTRAAPGARPLSGRSRRAPSRFTLLVAFLAGILVHALHHGSGLGPQGHAAPPDSDRAQQPQHWLIPANDGQLEQLERQLRGLDVAMLEIGHRFGELYFAGQDRNWPFANYQIEKIELTLQLALERRPLRAASAEPFLAETIPLVKQAIARAAATGDPEVFNAALERARTDCMKCHVAEDVPHFTVYFPEARASVIRPDYAP